MQRKKNRALKLVPATHPFRLRDPAASAEIAIWARPENSRKNKNLMFFFMKMESGYCQHKTPPHLSHLEQALLTKIYALFPLLLAATGSKQGRPCPSQWFNISLRQSTNSGSELAD